MDWFFVASVPVLFGVSVLFTPVFLNQSNVPVCIKKHKGLVSMSIDTILLYAVIIVIGFYTGGADYWRISLSITAVSCIAPWLMFVIIRYLKTNVITKIGLCTMIMGIFMGIINIFIGYLLKESETWENNVVNVTIGASVFLCGVIMFLIGFVKESQKR